MTRLIKNQLILLTTCLILAFVGSAMGSEKARTVSLDPLTVIETDAREGRITTDRKAVLQIMAIKKPAELPSDYQILDLTGERTASRAATMALVEIKNRWEELSPATRSLITSYLAQDSTEFTFASPSGFFLIHYDTTGVDGVSGTDEDSTGVPDFVEKCAAYLDTSLSVHLEFGYAPPPADNGYGGDDRFDVFFEEMPYYGYAIPEGEGDQEWNDWYSYLILHRNFTGFPPNPDPEGSVAGAAKATCAHELHHCVQFGYDINEPFWFMELDAVFMEDMVFDHTDDNYGFLPEFMDFPETSLMEGGMHAYASFIWEIFLAQRIDTALMVSVLEGMRYDDAFDALSDTLLEKYGWTTDAAFVEFAVWNFFTGFRDDGQHYEEGSAYPLIQNADVHSYYPLGLHSSPINPDGYAASYIRFEPGMFEGNLRLQFDGDDSREWAAFVVESSEENQHQVQELNLDPVSFYASAEVYDFHLLESVTLIAVNLSEFTAAASFDYNAHLFGNYRVASLVLTTDSLVYSGVQRLFDYQVNNTSSLNDIYDIIYWDDSGWVTIDTVDKFILAGDSIVVQVPVRPPVGTPVGSKTTLHFMAVSKNDPTVFDEQLGRAVTILQVGDTNFDGIIDLGDLTHIIGYLFLQGPEPLPVVESGNFDCDPEIIVDLSDLTFMIAYLFLFGPLPACNPF